MVDMLKRCMQRPFQNVNNVKGGSMKDHNEKISFFEKYSRKKFLAMMAALTGSIMIPKFIYDVFQGGDKLSAASVSSHTDRLGKVLPLRRLGRSGPTVTNLGVGGYHVGNASDRDAQAIIEKALEEGIRFFDNAPFYGGGIAEKKYGKFLTPKYRDSVFLMTKTLAGSKKSALADLDASLSRMKTDHVDLWQMHSLDSPGDVDSRIENGVLDAFLEAKQKGKVKYFGFTGHSSYKAHMRMLEMIKKYNFKMTSSQMPVNPADPHYKSFITNVVPKCVDAGIGVLAMKTLSDGRFFGGNRGWGRKNVSVKPIVPNILSVEDVLGFVWSLPVTTLISGMENAKQVSQNAALARKTWDWNQAERQKRIDAVAKIAGPDLEFYKN